MMCAIHGSWSDPSVQVQPSVRFSRPHSPSRVADISFLWENIADWSDFRPGCCRSCLSSQRLFSCTSFQFLVPTIRCPSGSWRINDLSKGAPCHVSCRDLNLPLHTRACKTFSLKDVRPAPRLEVSHDVLNICGMGRFCLP